MVTVREAEEIILQNLQRPEITSVPIEAAAGKILGETITADRDFPSFTRASMDGIAIQYDQFSAGRRIFKVEGTQAAGQPPLSLQNPSSCIEIMTGAMLPAGCDTVVRYEDVTIKDGNASVIEITLEKGQFTHPQSQDAAYGDQLLRPGFLLSSAEVALLASVGKSSVKVKSFGAIAIISTGDELVAIESQPKPWQIRRSNASALAAALLQSGVESKLYHITDNEDALRKQLSDILKNHRTLILSGGVSKGKFDFVPKVLTDLGVTKLFHQVSQKPGKPFWFGRSETHTVFALPGNPVSTFMCFFRYIRPWLFKSVGHELRPMSAVLASDYSFKSSLTYFLQVKTMFNDGKLIALPDAGGGSGDFANLKDVDGFIELPLERNDFKMGESFPYYSFRL